MGVLAEYLKGRKFPFQFLSAVSLLVGIAWLLQLPTQVRNTYVSENALLPAQVHTYFGGSEANIFRAYLHEVEALQNSTSEERLNVLGGIFKGIGLKFGTQKYEYTVSGETISGVNGYALLQAPRGDATEAIVIVAPWLNADGVPNKSGVALLITLSRYLKRWSLWAKDIIFLVTEDSRAAPQAWIDAYHDTHDRTSIQTLPIKSGAIQGALVIDFPTRNYKQFHLQYDGINGQLPNLDIMNTFYQIAHHQMGIPVKIQEMWTHKNSYEHRLKTMVRGMVNQALGHSSGAHSSFIPYHIDAITIQAIGSGWHNEIAFGRTLESCTRSLNNLLEHFHQSFFFYFLMSPTKFVSIGTYLPSAMLIAVNFTITAIGLWLSSSPAESPPAVVNEKGPATAVSMHNSADRSLFLPVAFVTGIHAMGLVPLYIFNHLPASSLDHAFKLFSLLSPLTPFVLAIFLKPFKPSASTLSLVKCMCLLLLGMFLSTLATINFSLSFFLGLFCLPLTFIPSTPSTFQAVLSLLVLQVMSPTAALLAVAQYWNMPVGEILKEAAYGWAVWGMWTPVVVWCVWWPAWVGAGVLTRGIWVDLGGIGK